MALKILAFGVLPAAFTDYFQMGISTGHQCFLHLCKVISSSEAFQEQYCPKMTRATAKKLSDLHKSIDGVPGRIASLDCMHIGWRLCPMAHKGHYQGSKGFPTIVLEAAADYNLWFWHATFGYPGSLNDINIWDQSSLLKSFLDRTYTMHYARSSVKQSVGKNNCEN